MLEAAIIGCLLLVSQKCALEEFEVSEQNKTVCQDFRTSAVHIIYMKYE